MTYKLIGSQTSPFVRRIRMLMENIPYDFEELSIFEAKDAEKLHQINPIHQVPVLLDGDKTIWDSRIIIQYLNSKHQLMDMNWEKENLLTAVEAAMSAGVTLLLSQRSGLAISNDVMYFNRQRERMESVLDFFKPFLASSEASDWTITTMSLYAFLDWATFRKIISIEKRPECKAFLAKHADRAIVKKTQIPTT